MTSARLATAIAIALVAIAVLTDFLAADRPIVLHRGGTTSWLLNLDDAEPRGDRLRAELGPDDWAIWPPLAHDPVEVRTGGALAILSVLLRSILARVGPPRSPRRLPLPLRVAALELQRMRRRSPLPYAVAIAAGGAFALLNSHGV